MHWINEQTRTRQTKPLSTEAGRAPARHLSSFGAHPVRRIVRPPRTSGWMSLSIDIQERTNIGPDHARLHECGFRDGHTDTERARGITTCSDGSTSSRAGRGTTTRSTGGSSAGCWSHTDCEGSGKGRGRSSTAPGESNAIRRLADRCRARQRLVRSAVARASVACRVRTRVMLAGIRSGPDQSAGGLMGGGWWRAAAGLFREPKHLDRVHAANFETSSAKSPTDGAGTAGLVLQTSNAAVSPSDGTTVVNESDARARSGWSATDDAARRRVSRHRHQARAERGTWLKCAAAAVGGTPTPKHERPGADRRQAQFFAGISGAANKGLSGRSAFPPSRALRLHRLIALCLSLVAKRLGRFCGPATG